MENVNLYIYSPVKGVRGHGVGIYVLEAPDVIPTDKRPNTLTGYVDLEGTKLRTVLFLTKCGLERIRHPSNLHIFVDDVVLVKDFMRISTWKNNGWTTTRGTEVKNRDLWQQVDELASCHVAVMEYHATHKYYKWMKCETERRTPCMTNTESSTHMSN